MTFDSSFVISQLTHAISAQNEEAVKSNRLRREEIECTITREEAKKDRTKKIHASILKMIGRASAKSSSDDSLTIPETFSRFINSENAGMAQYELVHQFKELGFQDISFAQGTVQALYVGDLQYARLKHAKQLYSFCLSRDRTPFQLSTKRLPHLPTGSNAGSEKDD